MKANTHIVSTTSNAWSNVITPVVGLDNSGLNWDVTKNPLVTLLEGKYPLPIKSHMSINRDDTNHSIGVVGSGYEPIQNSQIWSALHRSLEGQPFTIVGSGYTHGGSRVFIQAKVDSEDFRVNGDEFKNIITLYSSHDGSSAFEVFDTSVRIICTNTVNMAKRQGGKSFKMKVRHTRNAEIRFENMIQSLETMFAARVATYSDLRTTAALPMTQEDMLSWAVGFYNRTNKLSGVASGKAYETVGLANRGMGNHGKTRYDLLNGVTQMLTHGQANSSRDQGDRFVASEFGSAAKQKAEALDMLSRANDRGMSHLVARGEELRDTGETAISFAL